MKNLWQDMKRFESKIEKHYPNIDHITGLFTYNSDYFPTTKEQIKRFIADKADEVTLKAKLSLHDRSTLNGALEIKRLSTEFIIESVQEYLDQEHKPMIENTLAEKNIKMGSYSAEKLGYCYRFLRRCGDLPINKNTTENDEPDFMFIGVTFDWWKFEHGNHEKTD